MPSAPHHPPLIRLLLVATLGTMAAAGESNAEKDMAIEVAKAGPDFQIQGEYLGTMGGKPLAAQVIATGGGVFKAVFEPGGFPGDGWDGTTHIEVSGKSGEDKATAAFDEHDYKGKISAGAFSGTDAAGAAFTLKKVNRVSPTNGLKPPAGALVLFDGSNMDAWNTTKIETLDGEKVLAYGAETKKKFTSYQLHVEFREPFKPYGRGQDRGNSGIYIHHTYEVQVLDSFGIAKPDNNDIASLYTVIPPLVNSSYPPLSWQTYDIDWQGPAFDAKGAKTRNAVLTVKLNGVLVQDKIEVKSGTGANKKKEETPQGGPLWLQDHHNPVYFRNIWLVEKP
jgi:hypothetical protein